MWLPCTNQWIRSEEGLTLETTALESLYGGQSIISPVDKTKLSYTNVQLFKSDSTDYKNSNYFLLLQQLV